MTPSAPANRIITGLYLVGWQLLGSTPVLIRVENGVFWNVVEQNGWLETECLIMYVKTCSPDCLFQGSYQPMRNQDALDVMLWFNWAQFWNQWTKYRMMKLRNQLEHFLVWTPPEKTRVPKLRSITWTCKLRCCLP